jgi:photosystem II stability/assembly factor-like uncharacterized protein
MKNLMLLILFSLPVQATFAQWTEIAAPLNYFVGTNFINDNTGFLLTASGYLERTNDGGITWDSIGTTYQYSRLNTSHFLDNNIGFIGGGASFPFPPSSISDLILKTTDGGMSFDSIYGSLSSSDIQVIDFADNNHGMFLGSFSSFKTSDGGGTIDSLYIPNSNNTTMFGSDIAYVDLQNAFALTHQYLSSNPISYARFVYFSNDEGDSWTPLFLDTVSSTTSQIQFLNAQIGFLAGGQQLLKTNDGGSSWQTLLTTPNLGIQQVHFVNSNTGFLSAQFGDTSYLYTTLDGGSNWQIELIDTNFQATSLSITHNFIYASDFQYIYKRAIDSISVGLRTPDNTPSLKLYPNPSDGVIQVQFAPDIETNYQIINDLGQILQEGKIQEDFTRLDLSNYASGTYTLVVSDKTKPVAISRIVKK